MLDLAITDSKSSDSKDAKAKVDDIEKGELIIRDLGYFSLEIIEKIIKKEAYVISRLNTSTLVYEQNGEVLSFESLYQMMSKNGISQIEKENSKIPIRLVINIVPDLVYQERIRKIEQYNRRKGFQTTNDYKARSRFNLFVTNIESKDVPSLEVSRLYKLRWQIELNFKIWKSVCS